MSMPRPQAIVGLVWMGLGVAGTADQAYSIFRILRALPGTTILDLWGYFPTTAIGLIFLGLGVGILFRKQWTWTAAMLLSFALLAYVTFGLFGLFSMIGSPYYTGSHLARGFVITGALGLAAIATIISYFRDPKPWAELR